MKLEEHLRAALAGRYRIERELGRGGMATVYLAEDLKHHRPVAVKILHPQLAVQVGADRFQREVEIAAKLSHPHILSLIDSGESEGLLYYVMPYVQGESLRSRLSRERRLALPAALTIAREVLGALSYAHARGVVHRDIKPENVMLHEGEAMVADFGIAKALTAREGETLTQTGTSLGTPAYMSPEQASGERELDGRSDIYSVGCMLHEILVGEPPFTGPTVQAVLVKRFTDPPPPVRDARPDVPEEVEQALLRALARDPGHRFSTAAEFAQALAAAPPARDAEAPAVTSAQHPAIKSIAVLPFADMSSGKDQDYFCEGIAEEIINALSKVEVLRVASRTSTFAFKGRNEDIGEIGHKLKVGTILEGSVRKAGNRLRVTAQLINVADGYHLWSERYDRDLEDVFAIQDEIAMNIVKALRGVLTDEEKRALERPRTDNVQAYEYYLRGRQFFHQFREKSNQFARRMFARAIEIDPDFALAYAGTADCSAFLYLWWDPSAANLELAESASRRALELAPNLAEAHASRGLALSMQKQYDEAAAEFERAIGIDPKLFEAHYFHGRLCFEQGRHAEAAKAFERAAQVRPEDYQTPSLVAAAYDALGRQEESKAARRRAVSIIEQTLDLNPGDARALYLGAIDLCYLGDRERSREWADRALAVDPDDAAVLYNVACAYTQLDLHDQALDCLEKATLNGAGHRAWVENDPDLNPLRDYPRFHALLERM